MNFGKTLLNESKITFVKLSNLMLLQDLNPLAPELLF